MVFWGQGKYFNDTLMTETGDDFVIPKGKYLTDQLNELALEFIDEAEKKSEPFMLYLSHKALHEPFTPPDRHKNLFKDTKVPTQDNLNDDIDSKPKYIREIAIKNRLRGGGIAPIHWKIPDKMRTVTAVDEGVGMIFDTLREKGILENTIVIFAGDNGYFVSEHGGLHDKRKAYEPSIRIPLIMWNPFEEQPRKIESLALNIDLAPYICEVADIPIPEHMQGISWEAILRGEDEGRDGFLYEYYKEIDYRPAGGFGGTPTTIAYRTKDWKLITYPENDYTKELYKISEDPEELYNLVNDRKYTTVLNSMDESLYNLLLDIHYKVPQKVERL
jgi:N-acetylglucosamine-6-sulfatase